MCNNFTKNVYWFSLSKPSVIVSQVYNIQQQFYSQKMCNNFTKYLYIPIWSFCEHVNFKVYQLYRKCFILNFYVGCQVVYTTLPTHPPIP
jgi:hypothetical protein